MTSIRCVSLASSALLLLAAACGGDDDGDGSSDVTFVDSGPGGGDPDSGPAPFVCPVDEAVPAVTALDPVEAGQVDMPEMLYPPDPPENPQVVYIFGGIGSSDFVGLDLWDGYGVFAETEGKRVTTGEFAIEGAEADPNQCGVCFWLYGNMDDQGETEADYIATSGTVNVTSIEGEFTATATNVTFSQLDPETGAVLADGCSVTIPSIDMTATIAAE